ncbi:MAG: DUF4287 domain-containing protein [Alphaproteobacteria bacterium]|nr:DUF4287 domain-containing protein [Alphaproteobacteria bacterium]MBU1512686.1 DUF4287 domain-containing protein [Alphaproteobacteria bacterium]MBU2095080.1 DUF4287 domain-containing protein [Alphaproteobacteria bacterium]MBU2151801.1 DUF4287 domain-containing protein [Alphaproteobacteria bacterium]MBU2306200.1 DUF4287 domain-containing protein [Alphaproteobacteria bacterium]
MSDNPASMTARQEKWFASILESMERETGKTIDEWVAIAKTCPETKPGKRKAWFKETHGIGTNRASVILGKAFPETSHWADPDNLRDTLWADPGARSILAALEAAVADLPGLISAQRKGFTAFSKEFQFAAARPVKDGTVRLGLAVDLAADPRLEPPKNEGWSERLKGVLVLVSPTDVDGTVKALLKAAWARS